jgi:hypothetical protein
MGFGNYHRKPRMGAKAHPLRKIVGTAQEPLLLADGTPSGYLVERELLECGHTIRTRTDFAGETIASKRRCPKCGAG